MNSRPGGPTLVLGVVLVMAAACGKKEEQPAVATKEAPPTVAAAPGVVPASTPGLDPCSLLTGADVQEAVGKTAEDGKPNTTNPTVCDYKVGDGGILSVVWKKVGPAEGADAVIRGLKEQKIPVAELPGLGDRSFHSSPGYGMTQLNTFRGADYVIVTMLVPGTAETQQKAAAQKLMEKALGKVK